MTKYPEKNSILLVIKDAFCCDVQWQILEKILILIKFSSKLPEMFVRQVNVTNIASRDCITSN